MSWAKRSSSVAVVGILGFGGGSLLASPPAAAAASSWQEVHLTGDDVELQVDAQAHARVDHALTYRVVSGTLKVADLDALPAGAVLDPVATVIRLGSAAAHPSPATNGQDGAIAAQVEPHGEGGLRVNFDGAPTAPSPASAHHGAAPRGLGRGTYVVHVRYAIDLATQGGLDTDGALWRLSFTSPSAAEGYDAAKVTFDLPAAPTPPRAVGLEVEAPLATLRRTPDRDVLTIARPRVARGEVVTWAIKVDPHALPGVVSAHLRAGAEAAPVPRAARWKALALPASLLLIGLGFGALVLWKVCLVRRAAEAKGLALRALVPLPLHPALRGFLAGGAVITGVAFEARGATVVGAAFLALAMLLSTFLVPGVPDAEEAVAKARREGARGPGRWLALAKEEAFAAPPRAAGVGTRLLDGTTPLGAALFLAVAAASLALGRALAPFGADWPYLAGMDTLALVPLFFTGTRRQLPPDPARAPSRTLRALHRRLAGDPALRVVPWGRVPSGGAHADELRLLVMPRRSLAGLVGLELGVAFRRVLAGYEGAPEVLVRVHEGSAAEARVSALHLAPSRGVTPSRGLGRPLPATQGRRPEERVFSFEPAVPTRGATLALARDLAAALVDRRAAPTASPKVSKASVRTPGEPERRAPAHPRPAATLSRAPVAALPA